MLVIGTLLMGFWLMLVGGLQGRFGEWGFVGNDRTFVPMKQAHDTVSLNYATPNCRNLGYHRT